MKVRFFTVYDLESCKKIGEVKHDPLRKERKWSALNTKGHRIRDVDSRLRAEEEVRDEYDRVESVLAPKDIR